MSNIAGSHEGGIRTVADLRKRCKVTKNGCWKWQGAVGVDGAPSVWCWAIRDKTSLGVLISVLLTGERPKGGSRWYVTCDTFNCANPTHRKEGTYSEAAKMARSKRVRKFSPLGCQRISMIRRSRPTKLTQTKADEIRASTESHSVLALRYGVCKSTISHIKAGHIWRPLGGYSVFNQRAA